MGILFQYILRGYPNIDMLVYQVRNHKFKPRAFWYAGGWLQCCSIPLKVNKVKNKIDIWTYQLEQFYNQAIFNPW